jgi:hypothetical protein
MNLYFSIAGDEAQFTEFVHEKTHSGTGRANHFRQYFLTDIYTDRVSFLSKICEQEKKARQSTPAIPRMLKTRCYFRPWWRIMAEHVHPRAEDDGEQANQRFV